MNKEFTLDTKILDGRDFAKVYLENILNPRCSSFSGMYKRLPSLASIVVGHHPAIESYVKLKEQFFNQMCLYSENYRLPGDVTESELLSILNKLNNDSHVDGILVHMPLPKHINPNIVIENIMPKKDVDGLSPGNIYAWVKDLPALVPATALASIALLKYYKIPLEGKHVVVVGRSIVIGKPVTHLLIRENSTVTVCHSRSKPLSKYTKQADILIAAVGKAHIITADMVKPGAIIVDVGINMLDGKLVGDVDYNDVVKNAKPSYISPVPGGVGPVTVAMLASNLLLTYELQQVKNDEEQISCIREYYNNFNNFLIGSCD